MYFFFPILYARLLLHSPQLSFVINDVKHGYGLQEPHVSSAQSVLVYSIYSTEPLAESRRSYFLFRA